MNPAQITSQLAFLLNKTNLTWPDTPYDPVFGRVAVTPLELSFYDIDTQNPTALIRPGAVTYNDEHPEIIESARWEVGIFGVVGTDQAGGGSVVGGNRSSLGSSSGRGVMEMEPLVLARLRDGTKGLGPRVLARVSTQASAFEVPGLICRRSYEVVATRPLQSEPFYQPVSRLLATSPGAGQATLTWRLPSVQGGWNPPTTIYRYDLVGLTVRRAAGATAPSSPSAGTGVATVGLVSTVADTPGAGQWSYAVFATYDAGKDPITGNQPTVPLTRYGASATVTITV